MPDRAETRVLLVDSNAGSREMLARMLTGAGHTVFAHDDPAGVAGLCLAHRPHVVLLDVDAPGAMPQALLALPGPAGNGAVSPVLALTSGNAEVRRSAVSLGAHDILSRPVEETELLLRVANAAEAGRMRRALRVQSAAAGGVDGRQEEADTVRESLSVLAAMADFHDDDTSQHARRVGVGAALVAEALGLEGRFVTMIRDAASLHDIGKVGISRRILLKPGKLEPAEWIHMMRHVEIGARILAPARSPVLRLAAEIARTHHERWDGSGYLVGLAGEEIPLSGRITALVDVWDTLTHERPYKPAWDEDRALAEITSQAGAHFDPRVVEAFLAIDRSALADLPAAERALAEPLLGGAQRAA